MPSLDLGMDLVSPSAWAIMTIAMEASAEPPEGKLAVAEVIRDRTLLRYHSDGTVASTVLRPYQFSGWNTGDPNRLRTASLSLGGKVFTECAQAWIKACSEHTSVAKGAVLYHALTVDPLPQWAIAAGVRLVVVVGRHQFYTDAAAGK